MDQTEETRVNGVRKRAKERLRNPLGKEWEPQLLYLRNLLTSYSGTIPFLPTGPIRVPLVATPTSIALFGRQPIVDKSFIGPCPLVFNDMCIICLCWRTGQGDICHGEPKPKPSRGVIEGATMDQPSWMQNTGQASGPGANAGGAPVQQASANQSGDA